MTFPTPWKLATIGAGIVSVILISLLLASYFENRNLIHQRDALTAQINDPVTGYVAQLSQARTNVAQLERSIVTIRTTLQAQAAEANAKLHNTEMQLAAAQATNREMEVRLRRFLGTAPQGNNLEERIRDVDRRATEEFLK